MSSFEDESPNLDWFNRTAYSEYRVKYAPPCSVLELARQPEGTPVNFDLYDDQDLPFLDDSTEMGRMVSNKVIQSSLDDDVMSDDETIRCAHSILKKELNKAINSYSNAFNKKALVRNLSEC
jgi:hypothetical protein